MGDDSLNANRFALGQGLHQFIGNGARDVAKQVLHGSCLVKFCSKAA